MKNSRHGSWLSGFLKFLEWYFLRAWKYNTGYYLRYLKKEYKEIYDSVDFFGVLCEDYARRLAKSFRVNYKKSKLRVLTNPIFRDDISENVVEKKKKRMH